MTKFYDLLPKKISDETAYCLVNFFMQLVLELESHYFTQIKRYTDNDNLDPDYFKYEFDDELPF